MNRRACHEQKDTQGSQQRQAGLDTGEARQDQSQGSQYLSNAAEERHAGRQIVPPCDAFGKVWRRS